MSNKTAYNSPSKTTYPRDVKKVGAALLYDSLPSSVQGAVTSLFELHGAQTISTLWPKIVDARDEHKPRGTEPSDKDISLPLKIKSEKAALDKCIYLLEKTKHNLRENERGPITKEEVDMWETMSVLTYLFVKNVHPLFRDKFCDDAGMFIMRLISDLDGEYRGVYRLFTGKGMKAGLSNTVYGGIIIRIYVQLIGMKYGQEEEDNDEYEEEEDNKRVKLKEAREYLEEHGASKARYYLDLKESGELIKANQLLSDIITAIGAISPAYYWNPTNKTKRDEELLNYLMECSCGSFFSGFNYVMEMPLNLGTPSLRAIVTLPSSDKNIQAVQLLRNVRSIQDIAFIFSWQPSISAVRKKRSTLVNSDNVNEQATGKAVGALIKEFYVKDPEGFLKLYEFKMLFDDDSITFQDCYESETYAKASRASDNITAILKNDSLDDVQKPPAIIGEINKLIGLERYDEPTDANAYAKASNELIVESMKNTNTPPGMIMTTHVTRDLVKDNTKKYNQEVVIKNHDGSKAEAALMHCTTDKSVPLLASLASPHLIRGGKYSIVQRAKNGQSYNSFMMCLHQAGLVENFETVVNQVKYLYTLLLWTEAFGPSIKDLMADPKLDHGGSVEKGRMATLPLGMSRDPVKSKVAFLAKLVRGKKLDNAVVEGHVKHLQINDYGALWDDDCMDSVVVACLVAELGLHNFAHMMDVVFGINEQSVGMPMHNNFENWLAGLQFGLYQAKETQGKLQQAWDAAPDYNSDDLDEDADAYFNRV